MARSGDPNMEDYVKILFDEVTNITTLAHYARVQANEAELRARYCMSLAEKATCEAESVHQVAESLTCTSKMVANMTLDYICSLYSENETEPNSRDISVEEQGIIKTLKQMGSSGKPERETRYSTTNEKERGNLLTPSRSPKNGHSPSPDRDDPSPRRFQKKTLVKTSPVNKEDCVESSLGILDDSVHIDNSNEHLDKFQEQFPESLVEAKEQSPKDLPKEFDSSHSLPILYEDSYQGPRGKKPLPWAEKKIIRKMQRKLREIDLDGNELDHVSEVSSEGFPEIVDGQIRYSHPISKETLLKSVRFSEDQANTSKNEDISRE